MTRNCAALWLWVWLLLMMMSGYCNGSLPFAVDALLLLLLMLLLLLLLMMIVALMMMMSDNYDGAVADGDGYLATGSPAIASKHDT